MARILILGGGFAGVTAAENISAAAGEEHDITLISASRRFTFFPALVPLVFGNFHPEEIRADLPGRLRSRGVRFVEGEVITIDPRSKKVKVSGNDVDGDFHFDYLVITLGRRLATENVPGFFEYAHHLLGVEPALKFKTALSDFRSGSIVVGLCPGAFLPIPVCESALALAAKFAGQMAKKSVSVTAVFPHELGRALAGTDLFRDMEHEFESKGIRLIENFAIERVETNQILSRGKEPIPFDLSLLIPPFEGQTPVQSLFSTPNPDGFAKVNDLMQLEGSANIYAAGDIISLPGPRFGYMAINQAKVAAANILAELANGSANVEYTHEIAWIVGEKYTDPIFLHYGIWDDTLADFDENGLLGMAKPIRERYGSIYRRYKIRAEEGRRLRQ